MNTCYICGQKETSDEHVASEMHGTVYTLCRRCMVDLLMVMRIEKGRYDDAKQ